MTTVRCCLFVLERWRARPCVGDYNTLWMQVAAQAARSSTRDCLQVQYSIGAMRLCA